MDGLGSWPMDDRCVFCPHFKPSGLSPDSAVAARRSECGLCIWERCRFYREGAPAGCRWACMKACAQSLAWQGLQGGMGSNQGMGSN